MHTHRCCSKIQIVTRSKFFPFSLEYTVLNRGAYSRQRMFCSKATLSAFAASDWPAAASSSVHFFSRREFVCTTCANVTYGSYIWKFVAGVAVARHHLTKNRPDNLGGKTTQIYFSDAR